MAGGRGSRLGLGVEKPLIEVGGKSILERVVNALVDAGLEVAVAVSPHTPETALKAGEMGWRVVESPGRGYVEDIGFIFKELELETALVVSADLPFISPGLVKNVLKEYDRVKQPICVAVEEDRYLSMGFSPSTVLEHDSKRLVPVGVNVMEKEEREDYFYIVSGREAFNVNTCEELSLTRRWENLK